MRNLAIQRIQAMKPYTPPLSGRSQYAGLLLDFNERTQPSPGAVRALGQFVRDEKLHIYPEYFDLVEKIATYAGVSPKEVMITNGTDQGIDIIFRTFADKGDTIVIPSPTFAMYAQYAQVAGNKIVSPMYNEADLTFPLSEVLESIDDSVKIVVVTNPNSPTGTLVSIDAIEQIAHQATNAIVYVDEAYFEFSGITAINLIERYPNVVVTRTFSKAFGLASVRIAYIIARPEYITEMLKVRGPYDINKAAYYAAVAALDDIKGMQRYTKEVMLSAKPYMEQFFTRNNVNFFASAGNFILFRPDNATQVLRILGQNGILVRAQDKPGIEGTLRLTIGTLKQMKFFAQVYETSILNKGAQKYAILDRDGTLIFEPQDTYQIDSLEKLQILDGVVDGLRSLASKGYKLIMITNQDGLGTTSFPTSDFEEPQNEMLKIFAGAGIAFERVFVCPHLPENDCDCRKPKAAMLEDFLRENPMDQAESFVCGDRESDSGLATNLKIKYVPMPTNGNFYSAIKPLLANPGATS